MATNPLNSTTGKYNFVEGDGGDGEGEGEGGGGIIPPGVTALGVVLGRVVIPVCCYIVTIVDDGTKGLPPR